MKGFIKKYGVWCACVGALFGLGAIFACFGSAANLVVGNNTTQGGSVYDLAFGEEPYAGLLVAWIFLLLAVLAAICASVSVLFKIKALEKFAGFIACGAALLLITAGILFFCTVGFIGDTIVGDVVLGVGAVLAAIFSLLGGIACLPLALANLLK